MHNQVCAAATAPLQAVGCPRYNPLDTSPRSPTALLLKLDVEGYEPSVCVPPCTLAEAAPRASSVKTRSKPSAQHLVEAGFSRSYTSWTSAPSPRCTACAANQLWIRDLDWHASRGANRTGLSVPVKNV